MEIIEKNKGVERFRAFLLFYAKKPTKKRQKYIHIGKCVNKGSIYRIKCAEHMKAIKINSAYIGEM